jgi:hypothetical protein
MIGYKMKLKISRLILTGLAVSLIGTACTPEATPPPVDIAGTLAVELAASMLTQTAIAMPPPSPTPLPVTNTPIPTETAVPEPTKDQEALRIILVKEVNPNPACRLGPSESYQLISYIHTPKEVELLGIGNVPGWFVIKNPYFGSPCWLPEAVLEIDPALDLSVFPVMSP